MGSNLCSSPDLIVPNKLAYDPVGDFMDSKCKVGSYVCRLNLTWEENRVVGSKALGH